jgi:hypothetical protein
LAIICGTFFKATFFSPNSLNSGPSGEQKNKYLHQEIESLGIQIGHIAEEAKAQKAFKKLHLQTIAELRAIVEKQQAKEVTGECLLPTDRKQTFLN